MAPPDLYRNLSRDSHGDPAAVLALIDPATNVLALEPRRTPATRTSLLMYAGFCRDQAVLISGLAAIQLDRLPELDARILAAWHDLETGAGAQGSTTSEGESGA